MKKFHRTFPIGGAIGTAGGSALGDAKDQQIGQQR